MKFYAIKTQSDNPQKPEGMPDKWPWMQQPISENEIENFTNLGWHVFSSEEYQAYINSHQSEFDIWFNNRNFAENQKRLRVLDLVSTEFSQYHPSKIDFTIHLAPNIVLNKKITMLKNGRPEKSEYFYNDEKICEIKFEFDVNAQNFVTRKKQLLGYCRRDGTIPEYYLIFDKKYDMTNLNDRASVIEERSDARQYIMKEIKSILNDVLGYHYIVLPAEEDKKTPQELWKLAGDFWSAYSSDIDSWYNTATEEFKTRILADDAFAFLDLVVPPAISQEAEEKSVRQYIADRITY